MAMKNCKECKEEFSSKAKTCPKCGAPNNQTSGKTWGCLIIIIFVVWAIGSGGSKVNDAANRARKNVSTPKAAPEQAMVVDIRTLFADYDGNEVRGDNIYKGKIIQVTGLVDDIKKGLFGGMYITMGTGRQFEIPSLQASFDESHNAELSQLSKGQRITIQTRISGLMMNVQGDESIIVK